MLIISGSTVNPETIIPNLNNNEIKLKIFNTMYKSTSTYNYSSIKEFLFVVEMRSNILNASKMLYRSRMRFRIFTESECNEQYWNRTREGGFSLKSTVKPSDAINDIYEYGRLYGTECATAIVIVYYKAVLDTFGERLFNKIFTNIYLMDWQNLNGNLKVTTIRKPADYFPGDCRYFKNPDVNPLTPEWQGENGIDLGNNYYYGHGLGILTPNQIIYALNTHRREGSTTSAYLLESCTLPNLQHLFALYNTNDSSTLQ